MQYDKKIYDNRLDIENSIFCKKTLVFYINSIHDGGAERVMVNLTRCFAEDGYKVILVTSFRDTWEYEVSPLVKRIVLEQVESTENVVVKNIKRIYGLRKVCKNENADVLISFMGEPNIRAIIAGIGLKTKTIISVRSNPTIEYSGMLGAIVKTFLLPQADGCVFQTKYAKEMFPLRLQNKSTIIYNMVKDDFYQMEITNPKYIVSCGRLHKVKNYEMLIRAYAKLDIVNCPLLKIYGQGPEKENLESLIKKLNVEDKVFLCGQVDDVVKVLQEAKLFVLTSNSEGMPNALMEAMAAGVPCISTDCPPGGPRELMSPKLDKWLIPVGDENCLRKKIEELLTSEKSEINLSELRDISSKFRSEVIYENWKEYIER